MFDIQNRLREHMDQQDTVLVVNEVGTSAAQNITVRGGLVVEIIHTGSIVPTEIPLRLIDVKFKFLFFHSIIVFGRTPFFRFYTFRFRLRITTVNTYKCPMHEFL